jgi:hypothetical protein
MAALDPTSAQHSLERSSLRGAGGGALAAAQDTSRPAMLSENSTVCVSPIPVLELSPAGTIASELGGAVRILTAPMPPDLRSKSGVAAAVRESTPSRAQAPEGGQQPPLSSETPRGLPLASSSPAQTGRGASPPAASQRTQEPALFAGPPKLDHSPAVERRPYMKAIMARLAELEAESSLMRPEAKGDSRATAIPSWRGQQGAPLPTDELPSSSSGDGASQSGSVTPSTPLPVVGSLDAVQVEDSKPRGGARRLSGSGGSLARRLSDSGSETRPEPDEKP